MLTNIKDSDLELAKHSNFLDDIDHCYSTDPRHPGIIVVVATKSGCRVCWECGQPFVQFDNQLGEIEKLVRGSTVPIYVHRRCFDGYKRTSFQVVMEGLRVRRAIAGIVKKTASLLGAAEEGSKRPILPAVDEIPPRPADPDWRFRRVANACEVSTEAREDGSVVARAPAFECEADGFSVAQAEFAVRSKVVEILREREQVAIKVANEEASAPLGAV